MNIIFQSEDSNRNWKREKKKEKVIKKKRTEVGYL